MTGLFTRGAAPVPLVGVRATGTIAGRTARLIIRQRFENREAQAIEPVYNLHLPESASVCGFTVATGDKILRGQVEESGKALKLYGDSVSGGDEAYLVDEDRPNIFTISLGKVSARSDVVVEVEYVSTLETKGNEVSFSLPRTISPRYVLPGMPGHGSTPVGDAVNPRFQSAVPPGLELRLDVLRPEDIAEVDSPSHSIRAKYSEHAITIEFSSNTVAMDRDFVLAITYRQAFETRGFACCDEAHNYLQVDFTPQFDSLAATSALGGTDAEVQFLLDCSGSMAGSSIEQAKTSLELFLKGLRAGTAFNVYRFGSAYKQLFPSSLPYDSNNLGAALRLLARTDVDMGGTELLPPLQEVYRHPVLEGCHRSVVLLTDGEVGNEAELLKLAKSDVKTRLFIVGIGPSPNEHLLTKMAALSGGASEVVSPDERIEPKVLRLFKRVTEGRLDDMKVDWDSEAVQAPLHPAIHWGTGVSIFARLSLKTPVPSRVGLSGRVNGVERRWVVTNVKVEGYRFALPLLWARSRISNLEDAIDGMNGSRQAQVKEEAMKSEIMAISRQYCLLSRETSFVGVESRVGADKTRGETIIRKVPVMLATDRGTRGLTTPQPPGGIEAQSPMTEVHHDQLFSADFSSEETELESPVMQPMSSDRMENILALQTAEGGFLIARPEQASNLGIDVAKLNEAAAWVKTDKKTVGKVDSYKLVCTAALLALLETEFRVRRDEWHAVVEKSRKWLNAEVKRLKPSVGGTALETWAEKFIRSRTAS